MFIERDFHLEARRGRAFHEMVAHPKLIRLDLTVNISFLWNETFSIRS
jgi:hypothetical protein